MKKLLFTAILALFLTNINAQSKSDAGALGVGLQASSLNYGASAKYNFTEIHAGQLVVGGANYGFGTNAFTLTGRYLYNFTDDNNLKPYVGGQAGYWSVTYDLGSLFGGKQKYTATTFGVFGGAEYSFSGLEQLAFNVELGYGGGGFGNGLSSISGLTFGGGVHYYFNL